MIDFKKYVTWDNLTSFIKDNTGIEYNNVGLHPEHKGLGLNGSLPFSISEYEFNYMKDFIITHNLKNGYELATGTGISTIAIGKALQKNNGKLVSLDSYIENEIQNVPIGMESYDKEIKNNYYENNRKLMELFKLDNVKLKKGWSPKDSKVYIEEEFGDAKLDFVFFDCPKCPNDFKRDALFLKDKLSENFAIFVHDTFFYPLEKFNEQAMEFFNVEGKQIYDFVFKKNKYHQSFPLSVITNLKLL